jgi:hypothetical protein
MFWGWIKGIFSSILIFLGSLIVITGFLVMEDSSGQSTFLFVIGGIMLVGGSYLKYVSKQTVRTTKK